MGAAGGGTNHLATGLERWFATIESLPSSLCPRKRCASLSGHLPYSYAARQVRARPGSTDAGLCDLRVKNWLSDWGDPLLAVLGHRFSGRLRHSLSWHGAIAADHALSPHQDSPVCAGGRMESGDWLPATELLFGMTLDFCST